MLSLVLVGDWVSYYLAVLNEVNPASIEVIDYLKRSLEQVR
jgi:glucose/mannose-6-phosphate isomerase